MDKNGASLPVLMKSITTSGETADINLQPLLGTDKSNPLFRALRDQEGERILLYYGLELLEVFPDCPDCKGHVRVRAR